MNDSMEALRIIAGSWQIAWMFAALCIGIGIYAINRLWSKQSIQQLRIKQEMEKEDHHFKHLVEHKPKSA